MLIIIEGVDRTGKTTVAKQFESLGYKYIHQSAPSKKLNSDLYLEEQMQILNSAASQDIVLDRSYYGELIWPSIYNRDSLLESDGLELLQELEESVGVRKILLHDPYEEEHWARCVINKEPLKLDEFRDARRFYLAMAAQHNFEVKSLKDFKVSETSEEELDVKIDVQEPKKEVKLPAMPKTEAQIKLETANAINQVLSKPILKQKGEIFVELEKDIRHFLNDKLSEIFGNKAQTSSTLTDSEIQLLKLFCQQLEQRNNQK